MEAIINFSENTPMNNLFDVIIDLCNTQFGWKAINNINTLLIEISKKGIKGLSN